MGIIKNIKGKIRNIHEFISPIENIEEELRSSGIAEEELETYTDLRDVYEKKITDLNKINIIEANADKEYQKYDRQCEAFENKMNETKKEHLLKIYKPFSKERKEYKKWKKLYERAKASRDISKHELKMAERQGKRLSKSAEITERYLISSEKALRNLSKQYKYEIKLVNELQQSQSELQIMYGKEKVETINDLMKNIKEDKNFIVNNNGNAKNMYENLQKDIKSYRKNGKTENKFFEILETPIVIETQETKIQEEPTKEKAQNKFKENINAKYFKQNGINPNILESTLRKTNIDLDPKQIMVYLGAIKLQNYNDLNREQIQSKLTEILHQVQEGKIDNPYYAEAGAATFKDIYDGKKADKTNVAETLAQKIMGAYKSEEQAMKNREEGIRKTTNQSREQDYERTA